MSLIWSEKCRDCDEFATGYFIPEAGDAYPVCAQHNPLIASVESAPQHMVSAWVARRWTSGSSAT